MSINKITYLRDIIHNDILILNNVTTTIFHFSDTIEITQFLDSLEQDKVYVVTLEFTYSSLIHDSDIPSINLSKPILITKNSNPRLIYKHIKNQIFEICNTFLLDDSLISGEDSVGVIVKYREINLF